VLQCLAEELLPGAIERNQEYVSAWVRIEDERHPENLPILYDPQTSGGLLVSLPPESASGYVEHLKSLGHKNVSIIGEIFEKSGREGAVFVVNTELSASG
jgi:selenide,water dikinase